MPSCFVVGCENGHPRYFKERQAARVAAGQPKIAFFRAKERDVEAWQRAVPRADLPVKVDTVICSDHFSEELDIKRMSDDIVVGGVIVEKGKELRQPILRKDAVPSKFPGPKYLSKEEKKRRAPPKEREAPPPKQRKVVDEASERTPDQLVHENVQDVVDPVITQHGIDPSTVKMPRTGWGFHIYDSKQFYVKVNWLGKPTHVLELDENGKMTLKIRNTPISVDLPTVKTSNDVEDVMRTAESYYECDGKGLGFRAKTCKGGILKGVRCKQCRESRKNEKRRIKRKARRQKRNRRRRKDLSIKKAQYVRLRGKVKTLKEKLKDAWKECAKTKKEKLEKGMEGLPDIQRQVVLNIFQAAKRKGSKGNRYFLEWIYEATLMRIKSPRLYNHIRKRNIMPLPSRTTLGRYMKKIHPIYGFQPVLFQVLKEKVRDWNEKEMHGAILVDEIQIPEGVSFDRPTKKTIGLVDLGKFTPASEKNEMADHVLEVMFQPFRGQWVQSLGCFLTKSNAKADVLSKVVLEAIALVEETSLKADVIVMHGATWNRSMFDKFGVGADSSSCEHLVDKNRRLWFISDFCHLVKCARNNLCPIIPTSVHRKKIVKELACLEEEDEIKAALQQALTEKQDAARNKSVKVPEGIVKRQHWARLVEVEEEMAKKYGIAAMIYAPNFSKKHVFPSGFERMNVKLAMQFFSNSVRAAMEHYRKYKLDPGLEDSEPTEIFISKMNDLVDAMNSTSHIDGLRKGNKHWKVIEDYLKYHQECVKLAKSEKKHFFSDSTDLGFIITLRATLELSSYLIDEIGYNYVMTARLNQDAIEQFFSLVRSFCGPDSHPNPKTFAQIHRLLTVYSLVQPPPGSNVSGVQNMKTLLAAEDLIQASQKERESKINDILDEVLTYGEAFQPLPLSQQVDHSYLPQANEMEKNIVAFMAGFTAFRQEKVAKGCVNCTMTFSQFREEAGTDHTFTKTKEQYGGYTYASDEMVCLIKAAEKAVQECIKAHDVHEDMYITTIRYLKLRPEHMVGCIDHMHEVTKKVIQFYLTMRMFFVADRKNEANDQAKKLKKQFAKQAKLT